MRALILFLILSLSLTYTLSLSHTQRIVRRRERRNGNGRRGSSLRSSLETELARTNTAQRPRTEGCFRGDMQMLTDIHTNTHMHGELRKTHHVPRPPPSARGQIRERICRIDLQKCKLESSTRDDNGRLEREGYVGRIGVHGEGARGLFLVEGSKWSQCQVLVEGREI
jgi:hypothetical protein